MIRDKSIFQNPKIALILHGSAGQYQIRTIVDTKNNNEDEECPHERVQDFYQFFHQHIENGNNDDRFRLACQTATDLLDAYFRGPGTSGSPMNVDGGDEDGVAGNHKGVRRSSGKKRNNRNKHVSPEAGIDDDDADVEVMPRKRVASGKRRTVRTIATDFETKDKDCESLTESKASLDDRKPPAKVARRSLTPDREKTYAKASKNSNEMEDDEKIRVEPTLSIDPSAPWSKVLQSLRDSGWKWLSHNLHNKVLVKPGFTLKTGKMYQDWFPTDGWGHGAEIKDYVRTHYGWIDYDAKSFSSGGSPDSAASSGFSANDEESCDSPASDNEKDEEFGMVGDDDDDEDEVLVDDNDVFVIEEQPSESEAEESPPAKKRGAVAAKKKPAKKRKQASVPVSIETKDEFQFTDEEGSDDDSKQSDSMAYSTWDNMWSKMQDDGWSTVHGGADPYKLYYLRPGLTKIQGAYGRDYFFEDDVRQYAAENYGWKGPRGGPRKQKICISEEKPAKKMKKKSKVKNLKPSPQSPIFWEDLKEIEGWRVVKAARYNCLHDWYYIRPGKSPSSRDAKLNQHYFMTERDAVNYAMKHQETLKFLSKAPPPCEQKSLKSSAVESPASSVGEDNKKKDSIKSSAIESPASSVGEDSLEELDEFKVKDCTDCWWLSEPIPAFKEVWRYLHHKLNAKYRGPEYVSPDGTICGNCEELQIHFCKKGLPPGASDVLTAEEMKLVTRFVSVAHLPKKVNGFRLQGDNSILLLSHLPGGSSFDNSKAWDFLCDHFGAKVVDNHYRVECIGTKYENVEKNYKSIEEVREAIRCYGLHNNRRNDDDVVKCHAAIILWSSVLPLPINKKDDHTTTDNSIVGTVRVSEEVRSVSVNKNEAQFNNEMCHEVAKPQEVCLTDCHLSGQSITKTNESLLSTDEQATCSAEGCSKKSISNSDKSEGSVSSKITAHNINGSISAESIKVTSLTDPRVNADARVLDQPCGQNASEKQNNRIEFSTTPYDNKDASTKITPFTQQAALLDSRESEDVELNESDNDDVSGDGESEENSEPLTQDPDNLQIDGIEAYNQHVHSFILTSPSTQDNYALDKDVNDTPDKTSFLTDVLTSSEMNQYVNPTLSGEDAATEFQLTQKNLFGGLDRELN